MDEIDGKLNFHSRIYEHPISKKFAKANHIENIESVDIVIKQSNFDLSVMRSKFLLSIINQKGSTKVAPLQNRDFLI